MQKIQIQMFLSLSFNLNFNSYFFQWESKTPTVTTTNPFSRITTQSIVASQAKYNSTVGQIKSFTPAVH